MNTNEYIAIGTLLSFLWFLIGITIFVNMDFKDPKNIKQFAIALLFLGPFGIPFGIFTGLFYLIYTLFHRFLINIKKYYDA